MLIDDGIRPIFPYKAPMTKKGFFRKYEYVYDDIMIATFAQITRY